MIKNSLIVGYITRRMMPFVIMFGASVMLHGGSSPGGGFQGGVIIGSAYILYAVSLGYGPGRRLAPRGAVEFLKSSGIYIYMISGLIGILGGYTFLANKVAGIPPIGLPGSFFGGGTLFWINIGIGITVASVVVTIFYAFLEYDLPIDSGKNVSEEGAE